MRLVASMMNGNPSVLRVDMDLSASDTNINKQPHQIVGYRITIALITYSCILICP